MNHATVAFGAGLILSIALYPAFITTLARYHAGQRIGQFGPASHRVKAGTPTMGGVLFCAIAVVVWLVLDRGRGGFVAVFALAAGAAIGIVDDVLNIRGAGRQLGLLENQKLALQAVVGLLVGAGLYAVGAARQVIPGFGAPDLGVAIVPVAAFAVIAASNAVNLTDGVDGLAGTCAAIAFAALLAVALHLHAVAAAVVSAAIAGGLVGFLVVNWYPARVFMGDTGSLALGCCLVAVSAELRLLWLLPLLGIVFVAETLSVVINVTAIRKFKRRVFRASPLHHHFEALGLREQRLVLWFAAVAAVAALVTVELALHLRGMTRAGARSSSASPAAVPHVRARWWPRGGR
jgi:phospho-N-acetylmuramoyl-pentapeptide-transferase